MEYTNKKRSKGEFMDYFDNQMMNPSENITVGRIINVDRQNRSFTLMTDQRRSSTIRFNLADNARLTDIWGRPMNFSCLMPGLRVRVRHAAFMTMSIPPQTTAFSVRVIH